MSGMLLQVVLKLPLGQTNVQQVSCKVGIIQGHNLLCSLVSLWAVLQAWKYLEVAVKLFNLDKKLTNQSPVGLFQ